MRLKGDALARRTRWAARQTVHYGHPDLWDVNICGVRGTWFTMSDPKKVTCKRCRRHLTYWVRRRIRAQQRRK